MKLRARRGLVPADCMHPTLVPDRKVPPGLSETATAARPTIDELKTLDELQAELLHLLPSPAGLEWEIRTHRAEYVAAGAIFKIGRRWFAHSPTFKATMLSIAAKRARSWAER